MKKPIISVIVPVYNVEKYLEKCLNSLVNQTLKDIEIIAINDGSTDSSLKVLERYSKKYKNIKIINKNNNGQGSARNDGIKISEGEYVTFVDSDDWVSLNMCELLLDAATKENADLVFANYIKVENEMEYKANIYGLEYKDNVKKYLLTQSGPCHKLIKTEIIKKNNLYFPELRAYEDIAVVPAWGLAAKKIAHVNEYVYYYLTRPGSTMKQQEYNNKLDEIFPSLEVMKKNCEKYFNKKYDLEIEWIYIEHLLHGASLRFFKFNNYKEKIKSINNVFKNEFINWKNNPHFKKQSIKYRIVCNLINKECYGILKLILKK